LWRRFCETVTSGAAFLAEFPKAQVLYAWLKAFDRDVDWHLEAATRIASQGDGKEFALACGFLKEVGVTNLGKPNVHIKEVFSQIGLSWSKDNVEEFRAIGQIA
jgi:hypothetical protein